MSEHTEGSRLAALHLRFADDSDDDNDAGASQPLLAAIQEGSPAPDNPSAGSVNAPPPSSRSKLLRGAVQKVVTIQRITKPNYSKKGIPLLPRTSVVSALRSQAMLAEHDVENDETTDQQIQLAATFVRDALANRNPNVRLASRVGLRTGGSGADARESIRNRRRVEDIISSHIYRLFFQLIAFAHCLLACWENIPPSKSTPDFSWTPGVFEVLFLCVYTIDQIAVWYTFGIHYYSDKRWEPVLLFNLLLAWVDWFMYYPGGARNVFRFARPFRPFFGVLKRKSLRRLLASVLRTIPQMLYISALLLVVVCFYATLGQQIFNSEQVPGYSQNDDNFDSWPDAAIAMFILSTTENYPNVANQAYHHRPVVATLFFATALFVMLWLVCPLILAIVYNHYLESHKKIVSTKNTKQRVSLVFAYQALMGGNGDREMDRSMFARLMYAVNSITETRAHIMFDAIDVDGSGKITIAEFMRLPMALKLHVYERFVTDGPTAMEAVAVLGPILTAWKKVCRRLVKWKGFSMLTIAIVLTACAIGSVWTLQFQQQYDQCMCIEMVLPPADDNTHDDTVSLLGTPVVGRLVKSRLAPGCVPQPDCSNNPVHWSSVFGLLLALIQLTELAIKATAFVPTSGGICNSKWWMFASYWNVLDVGVVMWCIIGYSALIAKVHERDGKDLADWFELARALPYLRLLSTVPQLRDILGTVGAIRALIVRFVLVYLSISYSFAVIGMGIVGGASQTYNNGFCQNCQMWSYETFPLAWLALLQMTVGNNWNSILYPQIVAAGTRWVSVYFILYRFFMTDVFLNIIEGVVIESYSRHEEEKAALELEERMTLRALSSGGAPSANATPQTKYTVMHNRELFDEISSETPSVLSPSFRPPEMSTFQAPESARNDVGISEEELEALEKALLKQEKNLASYSSRNPQQDS